MNKKIGCLIIHGFAGNLKDIEKLNRFLLKKGFETSCPLLKGHALTKKDLARTSYSDWISSAEESLMELSKKSDRVVLIGFSMGGLIAFNLAIKHDIYKMVTLSAPIYHWDLKRMVTNIINDIKIIILTCTVVSIAFVLRHKTLDNVVFWDFEKLHSGVNCFCFTP